MSVPVKRPSTAVPLLRKISRVVSQLLLALTTLVLVVLVFILLQSRISGDTPTVAGYQIYIVLSGSMRPAFNAGSIVLVRQLEPNAVRVGDIITFLASKHADDLIVHRVVAVNQTVPHSFTTRGDANNMNDVLPVPAGNLVGRVEYSIPYLGYLFSFVRSRMGILLLVIGPAILMLSFELRKHLGETQTREKEQVGGGGFPG